MLMSSENICNNHLFLIVYMINCFDFISDLGRIVDIKTENICIPHLPSQMCKQSRSIENANV